MILNNIQFNKDKLFFTADPHFFHKNIIKYCDRPFKNTYEMNKTIVENWNKKIPKDAIVFILGDVSLTAIPKVLNDLLHSLNGTKYLIKGNHEKDALKKDYIKQHWAGIYDIAEIFVEDEEMSYGKQHLIMCHYPMITWNAAHRNSWQLFGHVHGGLSNKGVIKHSPAQMDVGVDTNNYTPYSYQEIKEKITKQMLKK